MKKKCSILNIGSGKLRNCIEFKDYISDSVNYFMMHLDDNYLNGTTASFAEREHDIWLKNNETIELNVECDIFEFLERYILSFDCITCFRFFEHIDRNELLYFIYLLSTIVKKNGIVDIISPNYQLLSEMIVNEDPYRPDFKEHDIIVSTEIFNESSDSHNNITTPDRIKRLFEYEKRFEVIKEHPRYEFDGRDIYFRSIIRRI